MKANIALLHCRLLHQSFDNLYRENLAYTKDKWNSIPTIHGHSPYDSDGRT